MDDIFLTTVHVRFIGPNQKCTGFGLNFLKKSILKVQEKAKWRK